MMLATKKRNPRIAGLIGLAAAPDFTKDIFNELAKKKRDEVLNNGITKIKKWNFKYIFTKNFFSDGKKNFIINKKFNFNKKIIFLHGSKDEVVPLSTPKKILNRVSSKNIELRILKNSDHRLSKKSDLENIKNQTLIYYNL